ncbi:MAG TPA: hypothetical protein VGC39_11965 [Candidatus Methylacidiphilales bacterium]
MPEHGFLARLFLISGGVLACIGLIFWFTLPISLMFPPYLVTAILALGYGVYCRSGRRSPSPGKSWRI